MPRTYEINTGHVGRYDGDHNVCPGPRSDLDRNYGIESMSPTRDLAGLVTTPLAKIADRLDGILDEGQAALDRRYGSLSTGYGNTFVGTSALLENTSTSRPGSLGALQDLVDRIEKIAARAEAVVSQLGEA